MTSAFATRINDIAMEETPVRAQLSVVDKRWRERALAELLEEAAVEVYGQALVETSSTAAASRITNRVLQRSETWLRGESMPTARALREHVLHLAYGEIESYRRKRETTASVRSYRAIGRHLVLAGASLVALAYGLVLAL